MLSTTCGWSRQIQASLEQKNSLRLLELPGEIRNLVYEAIVETEDLHVHLYGTIRLPPLAYANKQILEEFKDVYLNNASKRASRVIIHTANFVIDRP
jgi:hypothetical protein